MIHFDDSTIPSVDELWRSLYSVWCTAKNEGKKLDDDTTGDRQNVGILTAENRQTWAAARLELLEGILVTQSVNVHGDSVKCS